VTSVILGFRYNLVDPPLPMTFNGVAPKATVIPIRKGNWNSTAARAYVYLADLKVDGHLGNSPLVINGSGGGADDVLVRAAIDYAIAHGVVLVSPAGNSGTDGMIFPARYAPVISAVAAGWVGWFPPEDPTLIQWILNDVAEGDPSQHFVIRFSAWELPGQDLDVLAPRKLRSRRGVIWWCRRRSWNSGLHLWRRNQHGISACSWNSRAHAPEEPGTDSGSD
jgi:hypothetical protein